MGLDLMKQTLIEALNVAVYKGCFGLIEVSNIVRALDFLSELTIPEDNDGKTTK